MQEAWIIDAVRTPVGKIGKSLATVRPDDLAAHVLQAVLQRSGVPGDEVEDVYLGCVNQSGEDSRNVARMALLLAGMPDHVAGCTVNRLCASGLESVAMAARAIQLGEANIYLGGGVESMSRAPWAIAKAERAFPIGNLTAFDTSLGWRFVNAKMRQLGHTESMGETAENLAEMYKIERVAQDEFAYHSHQKAVAAQESGKFKNEIIPVETRTGVVQKDDGPRADTNCDKLATLKPVFRKNGSVTAGNSSSLNDGAAALLLVSKEYAIANGLQPLARVVASAVAGVPPRIMGIGPVPAVKKVCERSSIQLADIDIIELNEAFSSQSLAVLHELKIAPDDERLNRNGGAIALGHPLGCTGARILTTLLHEMKKMKNARLGLVTLCIGVGQGMAMIVERIE